MDDLAALAARTAFPGRVRQFAADDAAMALGLAIGCAWAESERGGAAAAVVPPEQRDRPLIRAGLALAARLGLGNLHLLASPDPRLPCEPLQACERQPVHLACLGRDLVPRWDGDPLAWCAAREPLLLLPASDPRWGVGPMTALALAWIAGDGRRVAWRLDGDDALAGLAPALELAGRMQLPLKLVLPAAALRWPLEAAGLARWWIAAPDAGDLDGVLAWALAGEEPCLVAAATGGSPRREAWTPGSSRMLCDGSTATILCLAVDAAPALAAATATGSAAIALTGLVPLPAPTLRQAARRGPLIVLGEELARHLAPLATLDPALRCRLAPRDVAGAAAVVRSAAG